jgi:hypothetical protein
VTGAATVPFPPAAVRVGLAGLAALALAASAEATHEVDHRYIVLGYVRDGAGRLAPGLDVLVVRAKTGRPYRTKTEANGFYFVVVHLHDEDVGDVLEVRAAGTAIRVQARFDPRDATAHRGTQVDFEASRVWERPTMFLKTLMGYLKPEERS